MPNRPRSVADELKQNRPFATSAEETVVAMMRTAALIRRAITQQLGETAYGGHRAAQVVDDHPGHLPHQERPLRPDPVLDEP